MGRLSRRQALVLLATAGAAGEGYLHFARGWSGGVPRSQAHGHGAAPSCADDSAGRLVAVGGRAANSRGPGRPTGPLRTPSMTAWILSGYGNCHRKRSYTNARTLGSTDCVETHSCSLSYHPRWAAALRCCPWAAVRTCTTCTVRPRWARSSRWSARHPAAPAPVAPAGCWQLARSPKVKSTGLTQNSQVDPAV
jgi:hypothetical protein